MRVTQATKDHVAALPRATRIDKATEMLRSSKDEGVSIATVVLYLKGCGLDDVEIGCALDASSIISQHDSLRLTVAL